MCHETADPNTGQKKVTAIMGRTLFCTCAFIAGGASVHRNWGSAYGHVC